MALGQAQHTLRGNTVLSLAHKLARGSSSVQFANRALPLHLHFRNELRKFALGAYFSNSCPKSNFISKLISKIDRKIGGGCVQTPSFENGRPPFSSLGCALTSWGAPSPPCSSLGWALTSIFVPKVRHYLHFHPWDAPCTTIFVIFIPGMRHTPPFSSLGCAPTPPFSSHSSLGCAIHLHFCPWRAPCTPIFVAFIPYGAPHTSIFVPGVRNAGDENGGVWRTSGTNYVENGGVVRDPGTKMEV